jgi:hypothetical protein
MNTLKVNSFVVNSNVTLRGRIEKVVAPRNVTMMNNNKQRTSQVFSFVINDGTGEAPVTIWQNLSNYSRIVEMIKEHCFYSISNFIVERANERYSQGHDYNIKPVAATVIVRIPEIENFVPFNFNKLFVPLSEVLTNRINTNLWIKGKVIEYGDMKQSLMNDNIRRELKISDEANENKLSITVWGELKDNIELGTFIEACGKVAQFNGDAVFSVNGHDIKVLKVFYYFYGCLLLSCILLQYYT